MKRPRAPLPIEVERVGHDGVHAVCGMDASAHLPQGTAITGRADPTPPASRESARNASLAPMEPSEAPIAPAAQSHRMLVLPPLLEAIDAWQAEPTAERRNELGRVLERVAQEMGLSVGRLRVNAPPLADLDLDLGGGTTGAEIALRVPGDDGPIGLARIGGDREQAIAMAHALERGFLAARDPRPGRARDESAHRARPGGPRNQRRARCRSGPPAHHGSSARPRQRPIRRDRDRGRGGQRSSASSPAGSPTRLAH